MKELGAERRSYDAVSVVLHWLIALMVIGLFASGLWMVELDYYDNWYYRAPWWHKSIGVVLLLMVILRFTWTYIRRTPIPLQSIPFWQHRLAKLVHGLMNFIILLMAISGYLIVTAKGDSLSVFDWFAISAVFNHHADWVDPAGWLHLWLAYSIMFLAGLHALAALKHHFIDKDATFWRILGIEKGDNL